MSENFFYETSPKCWNKRTFSRFSKKNSANLSVFQALLWAEPVQNKVCPWPLSAESF